MIHIIANPRAGGGRAVPEAGALARELASAGLSCHVHIPADRQETRRIAARADPSCVAIACGGDGTVHDVLQGIMAAGDDAMSLAIWPVGTGNDIARGLGVLDADLTSLIGRLASHETFAVDVGSVVTADQGEDEPEYFLGVLSCGFDSQVNERANALPARVGRARYLIGVARELPTYRPRWFSIDSDGTDKSMAAMVLAIGNGPAYGSGMYVCPGARSDDGLFDITMVTNTPKRTFVSVLPKVYTGQHIEHESVVSWRAASLRVDAPDSVVYADGERIGRLPARVHIHPGRLRFCGPTGTATDTANATGPAS